MGNKNFKDPIYGYIQVDEKIVHNIIDNACFQRLRNIRQTSYEPLYSAALHNRFIHSIGVYHLGIIAAKSICSSLEFFNLPKDINNSLLLYPCIATKSYRIRSHSLGVPSRNSFPEYRHTYGQPLPHP